MSERKVQVGEEIWTYKLGRGNAVIRAPGTRRATIVTFEKLTGRSPDVIERGQWKKTSDGMVKPGHVRGYIVAHEKALR